MIRFNLVKTRKQMKSLMISFQKLSNWIVYINRARCPWQYKYASTAICKSTLSLPPLPLKTTQNKVTFWWVSDGHHQGQGPFINVINQGGERWLPSKRSLCSKSRRGQNLKKLMASYMNGPSDIWVIIVSKYLDWLS